MKEEVKYNLINYLIVNKKKQILLSIILVMILVGIFVFSFLYSIYDIEIINAQTNCENNECVLKFYNNDVNKKEILFVRIKDKKYEIDNLSFSKPELDNTNNFFQEVTLKLKKYKGENNEIVEIKLYKNKEKIIKKIFKLIVER